MYENGLSAVTSDTVCFPAKLVHGHIRARGLVVASVEDTLGRHHHVITDVHLAVQLAVLSNARIIANGHAGRERCTTLYVYPLARTLTDSAGEETPHAHRELAVAALREQLRSGGV